MSYRISPMSPNVLRDEITAAVAAYTKAADTPFDVPGVLHKLLSRDEFLGLLRDRVNQAYMPSATGKATYNSKPDYVRKLTEADINTDAKVFFNQGSGYYTEDSHFSGNVDRAIWHYMDLGRFAIITNLANDLTFVALTGTDLGDVHPWTTELLAVDRLVLNDQIDTYC